MHSLTICLGEIDLVLHHLARTKVAVQYAFELIKHAYEFVSIRQEIIRNRQVFLKISSRIVFQCLHSVVPIHLFVSVLGHPTVNGHYNFR